MTSAWTEFRSLVASSPFGFHLRAVLNTYSLGATIEVKLGDVVTEHSACSDGSNACGGDKDKCFTNE
jgi:hypothetical protein